MQVIKRVQHPYPRISLEHELETFRHVDGDVELLKRYYMHATTANTSIRGDQGIPRQLLFGSYVLNLFDRLVTSKAQFTCFALKYHWFSVHIFLFKHI